ncbi:MAG: nucleotide sugar dehydrogenase [Kiloniellales bacterium]|nr:nucleotide sugar dehydrogenase [Kiloniellales bacterium]
MIRTRRRPPTAGPGGEMPAVPDPANRLRPGRAGQRPVVCVQGLGFVGAAVALAVARARDAEGRPRFDVVGVDLETPRGRAAIESLNQGRFPFATEDRALEAAARQSRNDGNLVATSDPAAYASAAVVLVDIDLDLAIDTEAAGGPAARLELARFREAIATLGRTIASGTLVIVETTVPPGTCSRVVAPALAEGLAARGLPADGFLLAHAYERVMPGAGYLDSIVNYWRVYAGHTEAAAEACAAFLGQVVNVADYPLKRLSSTTASETAKVLENSYRAVNIAFMDEWGRFAEAVGLDLFEVIDAVRQRPTHANLRQPGFGVGGYCLPKDPLLALAAAREIFRREDLDFPFCRQAVAVNRAMPLASLDAVEALLGGSLAERRLLLLGVSYRPEVADTRNAPAAAFVMEARRRGASVAVHDPLVRHWPELDIAIPEALPDPAGCDAVVVAVGHDAYRALDFPHWLGAARPKILDADSVLDREQRDGLARLGCPVAAIGRGGTSPCAS